MTKQPLPNHLLHKPIVAIDYEEFDPPKDAKFLSIGRAQWNNEDISGKVIRWDNNGKWARQSEELPLWRIIDLATLLSSIILKRDSNLNEEIVSNKGEYDFLLSYINENMELLWPKLEELKRVLNTDTYDICDSPNIFSIATSELSQDAFIVWLLKWADPLYINKDKNLYNTAKDFLKLLLGGVTCEITSIKAGRQLNNIDIWAIINENTILIIEDKVNTTIHSHQLERYQKFATKIATEKDSKLVCTYIKTGNEQKTTLEKIKQLGYKTIERKDIINCLNNTMSKNLILKDYLEHLLHIEKETNSYLEKPVCKWSSLAWEGFYKDLENRLDITDWSYVSNPSGGFLGIWWHFINREDCKLYLQIEQGNLCIKIGEVNAEKGQKSQIRDKWHNRLLACSKKFQYFEIQKPSRFGCGEYMTIAVVNKDELFGKEIINIENVIDRLHKYENLLDNCI